MMRDRIDRAQAFELLRSSARSKRRPIAELAGELLKAAENLNAVGTTQQNPHRTKRRDA